MPSRGRSYGSFAECYDRWGGDDNRIELQHPLEIRVEGAGDFAVSWKVFYYTKNIKELLQTRQAFIEVILRCADEKDIRFATPVLHQEILA